MTLWLCPLLGFLLGSIPFGIIISRAHGVNIRDHGSGNIGATNVLRTLGKKAGITCLLLDALKGFLPVLISMSIIRFEGFHSPWSLDSIHQVFGAPELVGRQTGQLFHVLTGLAAILGHNYSPFIGFRGGKGISTSAGVLIGLYPIVGLILVSLSWLALFLVTRYVSVASMGAAVLLPVLTLWGSWHHGRIQDGTWNRSLFVLSIAIAFLAVWRHRSNIRRLMDGTESRFERKPKKPKQTPTTPDPS